MGAKRSQEKGKEMTVDAGLEGKIENRNEEYSGNKGNWRRKKCVKQKDQAVKRVW